MQQIALPRNNLNFRWRHRTIEKSNSNFKTFMPTLVFGKEHFVFIETLGVLVF